MGSKKQSGVSDAVYTYFTNHRNVELHANDMAEALGFTPLQVMSAVSHIRNKWGGNIESPRKGWYVFRGTAAAPSVVPHKAKAEVVALLADDRLLVTVEGVVYVATPLEVD